MAQEDSKSEGVTKAAKQLASNIFQPETLVFTFSHVYQAKEAQDQQIKGFETANRYYHIQTSVKADSCVMYRFQLKGYAYGCSKPLDIIWCGYPYGDGKIVNQVNVDLHNIGFKMGQYISSSKQVCLKFGPINRFCNGFALYYSAHYANVKQGLKLDEYSIVATAEDGTI
eukprot:324704_1